MFALTPPSPQYRPQPPSHRHQHHHHPSSSDPFESSFGEIFTGWRGDDLRALFPRAAPTLRPPVIERLVPKALIISGNKAAVLRPHVGTGTNPSPSPSVDRACRHISAARRPHPDSRVHRTAPWKLIASPSVGSRLCLAHALLLPSA